ncbi:MAG: hypothetical protein ACOCXQ_03575 [Patescibacteria group bacterium]
MSEFSPNASSNESLTNIESWNSTGIPQQLTEVIKWAWLNKSRSLLQTATTAYELLHNTHHDSDNYYNVYHAVSEATKEFDQIRKSKFHIATIGEFGDFEVHATCLPELGLYTVEFDEYGEGYTAKDIVYHEDITSTYELDPEKATEYESNEADTRYSQRGRRGPGSLFGVPCIVDEYKRSHISSNNCGGTMFTFTSQGLMDLTTALQSSDRDIKFHRDQISALREKLTIAHEQQTIKRDKSLVSFEAAGEASRAQEVREEFIKHYAPEIQRLIAQIEQSVASIPPDYLLSSEVLNPINVSSQVLDKIRQALIDDHDTITNPKSNIHSRAYAINSAVVAKLKSFVENGGVLFNKDEQWVALEEDDNIQRLIGSDLFVKMAISEGLDSLFKKIMKATDEFLLNVKILYAYELTTDCSGYNAHLENSLDPDGIYSVLEPPSEEGNSEFSLPECFVAMALYHRPWIDLVKDNNSNMEEFFPGISVFSLFRQYIDWFNSKYQSASVTRHGYQRIMHDVRVTGYKDERYSIYYKSEGVSIPLPELCKLYPEFVAGWAGVLEQMRK